MPTSRSRHPVAFMSYAHTDDEAADGGLTQLRRRLEREIMLQTGTEVTIFQDRGDIRWGEEWRARIESSLGEVAFLIPILTPNFFKSSACRRELDRFIQRERELGRRDLIFPIYYVTSGVLEDPNENDYLQAHVLADHQYADWRDLRFKSLNSEIFRRGIAEIAERLGTSISRPEPSGRPRARRVFVSYGHRDMRIASELYDALQSEGLSLWMDSRAIRPGDRWVVEIEEQIRSADAVLVLITEDSLSSRWVEREFQLALGSGASGPLVVPVYVDDAPMGFHVPYDLATRQGVTLDSKSPGSFREVARQVRKALDVGSSPDAGQTSLRGAGSYLDPAQVRDIAAVVMEAFASAGRPLRQTDQPEMLAPEAVWVSAQVAPTARELERFADQLPPGRLGYFVNVGDLTRDAQIALDQMRVGGKPVVTISVRALRAALTDGRVRLFLSELERSYGTKDNLFDTKNALVDERFLFGRDMMLNTIGAAIRRDEHVLITGLRKVGKTSLLNVLRQHLADQPACMIDLQRFDREKEDWPRELFHLVLVAFDRWGQVEREQWPFKSGFPGTATELERELERRYDHLGVAGAGQRIVVILDEIERVFPRPGEVMAARRWAQASGALRALAQGDHRYITVIGADLRPIANRENDLGFAGTNPFFNFFQEMPVPLLDRDAIAEMVESVGRAMGVDGVARTFIDRLFELSGGHPSLARSVAGEAFRQRQSTHRLVKADLDAGVNALHDADVIGFFIRNNLWQLMTAAERAVIASLTQRASARWSDSDIISRSIYEEAYSTLRSQGIVDNTNVKIGLFESWIRDHVQSDER